MKTAVIGSRSLMINDLEKYLPEGTDEIISGGARGVDSSAAEFARANGIRLTEIRPNYEKYARAAPIRRNEEIADVADTVVAFWDGKSKGTLYVINYCIKKRIPLSIYYFGE